MSEYVVIFEVHKNQKIISHKYYRMDKKKYDLVKKYLKNTIIGVSKKQNPKYSNS